MASTLPLASRVVVACSLLLACGMLPGCHRGAAKHADVVYVVSKRTYLRDRIAPVSSKVAEIHNGEKLEVLDRARRFLNVRTPDGKSGWVEEHAVIAPETYDAFLALRRLHEKDPVVANGVLRDELFAHVSPGRDTDRFMLLPEGDKLQLLERASVKKLTPQETFRAQQQRAADARADAAAARLAQLIQKGKVPPREGRTELGKAPAPPGAPEFAYIAQPRPVDPNAPPPEYEDWWLARDARGQVGWLLGRRIDVAVPDEVVRYTEGKKIVGAYLLAKIPDPASPFPDQQAPEYVMVLNPFQDGLPYDYSRVRVLVWNPRKHRYEGGLRMNDLVGYLPVTVQHETLDPKGPPVPTFTLRLGVPGVTPVLDPVTGRLVRVKTVSIKYRLDGQTVRRVPQAGESMPDLASSASLEAQKRQAARALRRHRH